MSLVYIPVNDLSDLASDAGVIDYIDFGEPILVGSEASESFRLGNLSDQTVNYTWSVEQDDLNPFLFEEMDYLFLEAAGLPEPGTLGPNETSDTLSLRLIPPLTSGNRVWVLSVIVTSEIGTSRLQIVFETVADRDQRRREYPERATSQTDVFSAQIDRAAEHLRLLRYDPVAYDPTDSRVIVERGERYLTESPDIRFKSLCDPCQRLNSMNSEWGYVQSETMIRGVYAPETDHISLTFTKTNTTMTYASTSSIIMPAEYHSDLQRTWALFARQSGADREQFKRTVFIFRRKEELWAILDVIAPPLGDITTYLEARCIQVHNADMGSPQFFNPWALTYESESDKPYSMYPCDFGVFVQSISDSSNVSNVSNASVWNPSLTQ